MEATVRALVRYAVDRKDGRDEEATGHRGCCDLKTTDSQLTFSEELAVRLVARLF